MSGDGTPLDPAKVAELAVDLWRIAARAKADGAGDRLAAAIERAEERWQRLGFEVHAPSGEIDPNDRARVVDHEPGEGPLTVAACLSPAVYYERRLVREAEIVTRGGGSASPGNGESVPGNGELGAGAGEPGTEPVSETSGLSANETANGGSERAKGGKAKRKGKE